MSNDCEKQLDIALRVQSKMSIQMQELMLKDKEYLKSIWELIAPLSENLNTLQTRRVWERNIYARMAKQMNDFQELVIASVYREHPNAPEVIRQGKALWETAVELGECLQLLGEAEVKEGDLMIGLINNLIEFERSRE